MDSNNNSKAPNRFIEKLREIYLFFEDKYYSLLDKANNFVPVYNLVDKIDEKFPSFVLFLIVLIVLFLGIFLNLDLLNAVFSPIWGIFFPQQLNSTLKIMDETENNLPNAIISINFDLKKIDGKSDEFGEFFVQLPRETVDANLSVSLKGFDSIEKTISLKANKTEEIILKRESGQSCSSNTDCPTGKTCSNGLCSDIITFDESKKIVVSNATSKEILSGILVSAKFFCEGGVTPQNQTTQTGIIEFGYPSGCKSVTAEIGSPGFETKNSVLIDKSKTTTYVELNPLGEQAKGTIQAIIKRQDNTLVNGAAIKLFKQPNNIFVNETQSLSGTAKFQDIPPGTYKVTALAANGDFNQITNINVEAGKTENITIVLNNAVAPPPCTGSNCQSSKRIYLRIIDSASKEPVSSAFVSIYLNDSLFDSKTVDSNGFYQKTVSANDANFSAIVTDRNHITKLVQNLSTFDSNTNLFQAIEIEKTVVPQNFGKIIAHVQTFEEPKSSVKRANVYLYSNEMPNRPIPCNGSQQQCITGDDGNATFSNLPAGIYKIYAEKERTVGTVENIQVEIGQNVYKTIELVFENGTVEVRLASAETGEAIQSADVTVFNSSTLQQVDVGKTDREGHFKSKPVPSNVKVFFNASAPTYISYSSGEIDFYQNLNPVFNIRLTPASIVSDENIVLKYLGLYDSAGVYKVNYLNAGTVYNLKFSLILPKEASYSNMQNHARVGSDSVNSIPPSNYLIKIKNVSASEPSLSNLSTCVDFSNVFSNPTENCSTTTDAKQANTVWQNPAKKTQYEVMVKVYMEQNLEAKTPIEIHYQAKVDIGNETSFTEAFTKILKIGERVCEDDCPLLNWSFWLQEENKTARRTLQNFSQSKAEQIDLDRDYNIVYEIVNTGKNDLTNFSLKISNKEPEGIVSFKDYASRLQPIEIFSGKTMNSGTSINDGSPLKFRTILPAAFTKIYFETRSDQTNQTNIYDFNQSLYFEVAPAGSIEVYGLPDRLLPEIQNQEIHGTAKEKETGALLADAIVKLYVDSSEIPVILNTAADGTFGFVFENAPDYLLDIKVEKSGFQKYSKRIPVQTEGGGFNPLYDCVKANPQIFGNAVPNQSLNLTVSAQNCSEKISIKIETQLNPNPAEFVLNQTDSKIVSINTNTATALGLWPIYVKAKFESDASYFLARTVEAIISDSSSCFSIDKTKFELPSAGNVLQGTITNSCNAAVFDTWKPAVSIDSQKVLLASGSSKTALAFDWWLKADYQEIWYVDQSTTKKPHIWKTYYTMIDETNEGFGYDCEEHEWITTTIDADANAIRFLSYVGENCTDTGYSNFIEQSPITINTSIGPIEKALIPCTSSRCNWTGSACFPTAGACPIDLDKCKVQEMEFPLDSTYHINSIYAKYNIKAGYYCEFGTQYYYPVAWQVYSPVEQTITVQEKHSEQKIYETPVPHNAVALIQAPQDGQIYELGTFDLDLTKDPNFKGGVVPDLNISVRFSVPGLQGWIEGNKVYARYIGQDAVTTANPKPIPFNLSNVSLDQNQFAKITVKDYTNR